MTTVGPVDKPRCQLCGDTRQLDSDGVCAWRFGCEHRQMVEAARMADLDRFLAGRPEAPGTIEPLGTEIPDALIDMAHAAMVRLTEEARTAGLLGADEEFVFDLSEILRYRPNGD